MQNLGNRFREFRELVQRRSVWGWIRYFWRWLNPPMERHPRHPERVLSEDEQRHWGWLPQLTLFSSFCVMLVALAMTGARYYLPNSEALFWIAILAMYALNISRLLSTGASRRERLGIVMLLGLAIYFVKIIRSPSYFSFYDELLHQRTIADILATNTLFTPNTLLPVSPLYPGLEILTDALVKLTGMDIFTAGLLLVGLGRLLFMLGMFLFYERFSHSSRVAGIATALYAANPHFIFFDAQYAYESLALVFALMTLYALEYRIYAPEGHIAGVTFLVLVTLGSTIVTHHITTIFLLIFLLMWVIIEHIPYWWDEERPDFLNFFMLAIVGTMSWMVYIATIVITYLVQPISNVIFDLVNIIFGREEGRQLFAASDEAYAIPIFERVIIYGTALLILFGVAVGVVWIWRVHRKQITYILLAVVALAYPATQVLRFTSSGPELAGRIGPFMYTGISFVLAVAIAKLYPGLRFRWRWHILFTALSVLLFWGGILLSFARWAVLPGAYMASADTRSIEEQGISTAEWANEYLGHDNVFSADRINALLMVSYGNQSLVTGSFNAIDVPGLFIAPILYPDQYAIMCQSGIEYLVVDMRFTEVLPMFGYYYEGGELGPRSYERPLEAGVLQKFDFDRYFNRIYDAGSVRIFQFRRGVLCDVP
jgi:hypothetical protein